MKVSYELKAKTLTPRTCIPQQMLQILVDHGIVRPMKSLLEDEEQTQGVLAPLCGLMRALTLDDDVRAEVSKAHLHASSLAIEVLCPLTNLLAS